MGILAARLLLLLVLSVASAAWAMPPDSDGDGVHDYADNCLDVPNRDQANTDRADEPQATGPMGNACDCDFDNDGFCGITDFNLFLPDFVAGVDSGLGTDMDGVPGVGIGDFNRFLPGFAASVPGPGALPGSVVDGSCDPVSEPGCSDAYTPGACFDARVGAGPTGSERPWGIRTFADGCPFDGQILIDAGFDAAAADPNNPTDAWVRNETGGSASCPNAAFATFTGGRICDASLPCDPLDHGRRCGEPNNRGGIVECGDATAPLACEQLSLCGSQCGYRAFDCLEQFHKNLIATCDALSGRERVECRPACIGFADLYAAELAVPDPGPGVWPTTDLADESLLCRCGTDPIQDQPPSVCGDGICESLSESCHPSSCPADCGTCALGTPCLLDADCGQGSCSRTGTCELGAGGATCDQDADCTSGTCLGGQCTSTCGDGICDGQETCGSTTPGACAADCGPCPFSGACLDDGDCASGACVGSVCQGVPDFGTCTTHDECRSGVCHQGLCLDGAVPAGEPCTQDSECRGDPTSPGVAGICDAGFCTDLPRPAGSFCAENRACESNVHSTPFGPHIGVCNLGTCLDAPVAFGQACDRDEACQWVCDTTGLICAGICNEGVCVDDQLGFGEACDSQLACGPGLFCSGGTCRRGALATCSSGPECASGICNPLTGRCSANCGDGFCDFAGGEVCGSDDFFTCQADCGQCGFTDGLLSTVGLCLNNENCPSGICNLGACIDGPMPPGGACSTNAACFNGACNFGTCIEELREDGQLCSTNAACSSGACNLGRCIDANSKANGSLCTTNAACTGVCNFGICADARPLGDACSHDGACQSGACNGTCVQPGSLEFGEFCLGDSACEGGLCSSILDKITKLPIKAGICQDSCGDGQCTGVETCGYTNVLTRCNADCGFQCGLGSFCLADVDCGSGICNFGSCDPGGHPLGSPCTTNEACTSGVCNLFVCTPPGFIPEGFPCSTHDACDTGLCSAGLCTQGGHPNGSLCTANAACASGICNIGICTAPGVIPALIPCTQDAACRSGDCTGAFVCAQVCGDGYCDGLELCGDANSGLECNNDCNLCGIGTPCLSNSTCGSGVCNFGFCHAGNLTPGKLCSTDAACRSGNCLAGVCVSRCGDGFCDGAELCGDSNNGLECNRDCNKCGNGTPCLSNSTCSSNTCNFGFCISYRSLGRFSPCTTDNACSSLNCSFGLCGR